MDVLYEHNKVHKEKQSTRSFGELAIGLTPEVRQIDTAIAFYEAEMPRNAKLAGQRESRAVHLEHHIIGSPHSWTDEGVSSAVHGGAAASPTALVQDGASAKDLIEAIALFAAVTDSKSVREYALPGGRIARILYAGNSERLELTIIQDRGNGMYSVISSYDHLNVEAIQQKPFYKER